LRFGGTAGRPGRQRLNSISKSRFDDWSRGGRGACAGLGALLGPLNQRIDLFAGQCAELILDVESQLTAIIEKLFALDIQRFRQLIDSHTLVVGQAMLLASIVHRAQG
jgi:hypothetical protein